MNDRLVTNRKFLWDFILRLFGFCLRSAKSKRSLEQNPCKILLHKRSFPSRSNNTLLCVYAKLRQLLGRYMCCTELLWFCCCVSHFGILPNCLRRLSVKTLNIVSQSGKSLFKELSLYKRNDNMVPFLFIFTCFNRKSQKLYSVIQIPWQKLVYLKTKIGNPPNETKQNFRKNFLLHGVVSVFVTWNVGVCKPPY